MIPNLKQQMIAYLNSQISFLLCFSFGGQTWKLWKDGTPLELLDSNLRESYSRNEVLRCIHIALLCVQEDPMSRPSMASIVLMLNSYSVTLALPEEPALFMRSKGNGIATDSDQSRSRSIQWSVNETSISELHPR